MSQEGGRERLRINRTRPNNLLQSDLLEKLLKQCYCNAQNINWSLRLNRTAVLESKRHRLRGLKFKSVWVQGHNETPRKLRNWKQTAWSTGPSLSSDTRNTTSRLFTFILPFFDATKRSGAIGSLCLTPLLTEKLVSPSICTQLKVLVYKALMRSTILVERPNVGVNNRAPSYLVSQMLPSSDRIWSTVADGSHQF